MSDFQHSYALIIGINDYDNSISPLKTAVSDATEIAHLLETKHHYTVNLLLDRAATLSRLRQVLETELPNQIQAGDRFLFYFAGHGIALNGEDGPEGYLIPQNAKLGNVSTSLRMSEVNKALLQLPCRHFLGILDCCFAGAFRWSSTRKAIPIELGTIHKERYDRFIQDPAWQVLTSAAYDQSAWDAFDLKDDRGQKGVHSPFACALIEALEGKADAFPPAQPGKPAGDGVITASELYLYLRDRVEIATEARAIRQTPGIHCLNKHDKGEYIFLTPGHALNLPPAPPLDVSKNPYRGLSPFEEEHCNLFFGRNALTQKLYEFVASHSLTVVLGASGSGKSSLVKAGLIPKLRQCKNGNAWFILPSFRPGESPFKALNIALASVNLPAICATQQRFAIATPSEATSSGLLTPSQSLANWFKEHPKANLLLVVDQFEELITLGRNERERQQFLEALAVTIATYPNQLHLVLTLRSDFEPQFRNTALEKDWQTARFVVPAMTREELRQAIEEPASARVMYFDPHKLVEQLIDEVANMPGALPLLSFALSELYLKYLKRQEDAKNQGKTIDRAITQGDYEELGGVTRSLTQRADQEYEALVNKDSAYAQTIQHTMLRMVAVGGELARRRVPLSELQYPEPENTRVRKVIQCFSEARLLISSTDPEGQPYVEPAHDALVRGWQRLLDWKQKDLPNLLLQRELTPTAVRWKMDSKSKRAIGLLWNDDPRLSLVKQIYHSENDNWLNSTEIEFVQRSLQRRQNNLRRLVGTVISVVSVLAGLTLWALQNAQVADRRRINAEINTQSLTSETLFASGSYIEALVESLKMGQKLKLAGSFVEGDIWARAITELQQVIYETKEKNRIERHLRPIRDVSFSPSGKILATASDDATVKLWDIHGKELGTLKGHKEWVNSVSFSPDGKLIATAGDGTVKLWDISGQELKSLQGGVSKVAFSPNSKIIAASNAKGEIKLWTITGQELRTIKGHKDRVFDLSFSPDGKVIASAGKDKTIKLWSNEGQELAILQGHKDWVYSVSFSSDGKLIATTGADGMIRLWDTNGKALRAFRGHSRNLYTVRFSPDGKTIASAGEDRMVKIWNLHGEILETLEGHSNYIYGINFSPDGKLLVSGSADTTVRFWSLSAEKIKILNGHLNTIWDVSFSPDGRTIVTGDDNGTIRLWNLEPQQLEIRQINLHQRAIRDVSFSPDGKFFASASWDDTVKLWDSNGRAIRTFHGSGEATGFWSVSFSPDSNLIAAGSSNGVVKLWDINGREVRTLKGAENYYIRSISFSPNGNLIATGSNDGKVKLWSINGQKIATFRHLAPVNSVTFSPNGQLLASASWDNTIKFWSIDGREVRTLRGHSNKVTSVTFNPDGRMLASASEDGTVKLWSRDGQVLKTFKIHKGHVYSVRFSPDGKMLASTSGDKKIILWSFDLDNLMAIGCSWLSDYLANNSNGVTEKEICMEK
jgi:WD40 repeat protein